MTVVLEPFALGQVEGRFGAKVDRAVEAALRHYARSLLSSRRPPEVPLFMREVAVDREAATEVEVSVPDDVLVALDREAGRQGVELDRIVAHAVFVYLHDIGADGRAGAAEENGEFPRSPGHAIRQPSSARRPRGTMAGARFLRRVRSAGGRSRFGRR